MAEAINSGLTAPANQTAPVVDEFEIMRRRVQQQTQQKKEAAQRSAKQQFAKLGNLPSGAAIKTEALAGQAVEQQGSQALQDINIAQSQQAMQQREAAAGRQLQEFGIRSQAETAAKGFASQKEIAQLGEAGATARQKSEQTQQLKLQEIQQANNLETLSATQEFQKAQSLLDQTHQEKLQNASLDTQKSLAEMQLDFNKLSLDQDMEKFAQSMDFQKLDMATRNAIANNQHNLSLETQSLQKKMSEHAMNQDNAELAMNKLATVINMFDSLKVNGFTDKELGSLFNNLDLGVSGDEISKILNQKAAVADTIAKATAQVQNDNFGAFYDTGR